MTPTQSVVTHLTELPTFVSQAEHNERTSTTPASFADIPPVLRHSEENVTVVFDPPQEGISGDDLKGTLYIIERFVLLTSDSLYASDLHNM